MTGAGPLAEAIAAAASPAVAPIEGPAAVAAAHAEAVDREGRFPAEAIAALRQAGRLGMLVPKALGGPGGTLADAVRDCFAVARGCGSAGMVLAMHHSQMACLVAHAGDAAWPREYLARAVRDGLLLASVTSEEGVGGNLRRSLCAPEPAAADDADQRAHLVKRATNISYGAHASALLLSARRAPDAAEADQVLWLLGPDDYTLERTGGWETMGMRGTRSEAFVVRARAGAEQALSTGFGSIATETMTPVTHILWAGLWIGIAADALDRARNAVKGKLRKSGGSAVGAPGTPRLAAAAEKLLAAEALLASALRRYGEPGSAQSREMRPAEVNMLKTSVSEATLDAVGQCLIAAGLAGYRVDGAHALSRHLRDLWSAPLMVPNDAIRAASATLMLGPRPQLGRFL
ncbi:acyl-CoA dehydrogenase family protein [Roseomonas sp. 18066]|uniref:acyl-CoA dehydrogenase family protein n=1 Tax=Roseomonas sp. 18066 TaxID=2681412 RepID=UPI00135A87C5|nr:acyl-CoA dehydrogenase family protein [Roseomonas sp. 18066]